MSKNNTNELLEKLYSFQHFVEVNIEDNTYCNDTDDEEGYEQYDTNDPENPGFSKGYIHFLDMTTNGIISYSIEENEIEINITDNIDAFLNTKERLDKFIKFNEIKSKQFKMMSDKYMI